MLGRNGFLALLVAAIAALGLALWLQSGDGGDDNGTGRIGERLLPGLEEGVNDLQRVQVILPGSETLVTLTRAESAWQVAERDGYPADWNKLRALLRQLAQAEVVSPKTARSEHYDQLGVTDVQSPDASGVELRLGSEPLASLIVGNAAAQREGRYVRLRGEQQSYLIDRNLDVPTEIGGWLDSDILDIQSSDIAGVTVRHPDGEVVRLGRGDDDKLSLLNLPEGREISGQWALNALANALTGLSALDVRRAAGEVPEAATRVLYTTKGGVNIVVSVYTEQPGAETEEDAEPKYLARFEVSREPGTGSDAEGAGEAPAEAAAGDGGDGDSSTAGESSGDEQSAGGDGIDVAALQKRLSGWTFELRKSKYNAMNKRLEDLLKPVESESESASGDGADS